MTNGGGRDDDLDKVVLDEDFVRGATVTELDAKHRRKEAAKREKRLARQNRKYRRGVRRTRLRRRILSYRSAAMVVALFAVVLFVPGLNGIGPLSYIGDRIWPPDGDGSTEVLGASLDGPATTVTTITPEQAATTTTDDVTFYGDSYRRGDCITWDQSAKGRRATRKVACDQPHIYQMVKQVVRTESLASKPPSEEAWDRWFDFGPCKPAVEEFIGAKLDPDGKWVVSGIYPLADGWVMGDRDVWCAVGFRGIELLGDGRDEEWTGPATADQARLYPIGSCLGASDAGGLTWHTVNCDGPHAAEVTGTVDLTGAPAPPDEDEAVEGRVWGECKKYGDAYVGGKMVRPVAESFFPLLRASWDAGTRKLQCFVSTWEGNRRVVVNQRLGHPPA